MPKCVNCNTLLPPEFLETTEDGLAKKCVFCIRETDTIIYFSDIENKELSTTKMQTNKEYLELLKELSDLPSIKDVIEAVKNRDETDVV